MGLKEINGFVAALIAIQGFILLAVMIYWQPLTTARSRGSAKTAAATLSPQHYYVAFLLFWSLAWTVDYFDWLNVAFLEPWGKRLWVNVAVDLAENLFFGAAAYVLVRGLAFTWNDRYLKIAVALTPALALLFIMPTPFLKPDNFLWKLAFGSLDTLLFVTAVLALGWGLFGELRKSAMQLAVIALFIFIFYALLQFPNAEVDFMDPQGTSAARQVLRALFAIGKIALFFTMISAIASFYRARLTQGLLTLVRLASLVMGAVASLAVSYYHLAEAVRVWLTGPS
jgi:uncharacterized membrane protein